MDPDLRSQATQIRFTDDGRTLRHISLGDLILQTKLRVATQQNIQAYPCPCVNCHGGIRKSIVAIREHHTLVGRDRFLTKSVIGGDPLEGYPPRGIWVEDMPFDDDELNANPDGVVDINVNDNTADVQKEDPFSNADRPLDQYHQGCLLCRDGG